MIENAQGYQLITPVGFIDGGILPARDVAVDGSAHAVRAEDLCFAMEAVKERDFLQVGEYHVMEYVSPSHVRRQADRINVWKALRIACYGEYSLETTSRLSRIYAVDVDAQFPDVPYTSGSIGLYPGVSGMNLLYPGAILPSCYTGDTRNHVIANDPWRMFYYDLKRADRLYIEGGDGTNGRGTWTATGTYTDSRGNTYAMSSNAYGRVCYGPYAYDGVLRQVLYKMDGGVWTKYAYGVLSGGNCTMTRVSLAELGRVASAVAVVAYGLYVSDAANNHEYDFYFTRKYQCTVTTSGIVVDPSMFLQSFDVEAAVLALTGINFGNTYSGQTPPYATLDIEYTHLVVNYNFRTNNLNDSNSRAFGWNWPQ